MNKRTQLAILLMALVLPLYAATQITISQIKGNSAVAVAVTATAGAKTASWATLGANCSITAGVLNCTGSTTVPTWATEVPAGTINGTNTAFTLVNTPLANSQIIFWNGIALFAGNGDYTISANALTMATPPQSGDTLIAVYQH
jgi:hypothetical protein